ncbi:hypothetical protein GCM10011418_44300 [Sphingobacterium alkalisoli]|nr:hypothetical protein GCM10011418_44300 [Sphingobacterium alkalisoli]
MITRNGQFVHYHFPAQLSIENSIYNKNFLREIRPQKINVVDTVGYAKVRDQFEIYLCESYYYKSYGIFNLLRHRIDYENSVCLNVNFLGKEWLFIKYDNKRLIKARSSESFRNIYKLGTDVSVKIFDEDKNEIFEMEFLNLAK